MRTPTFSVEVITLSVSDIERALRFYVDQVGFTLDVDYSPNDAFRVVQLTPRWRFHTRARPRARRLCQLRQLLRSGWQRLGATGTGLPQCVT